MDCFRRFLLLLLSIIVLQPTGCSETIELPLDPKLSVEAWTGTPTDAEPTKTSVPSVQVGQARIRDEISVATWNIQVFGQAKIKKKAVMEVIVDVIRRFDIVAIQELRSKDQSIIHEFLAMINADGSQYNVVVGPRLGRTISREQYLYVYDTTRIELIPGSAYSVNDVRDVLHREPLVASFRVIGALSGTPWSFTLVNIHTDPDEAEQEVNMLDELLYVVRQHNAEDDVILLGDLNAAPDKLGDLRHVPGLMWVVADQPTNTRGTKLYDNILFSGTTTREFTGFAGVLNLREEYALSLDEAIDVSDHLPVWSTFAPVEQPAAVAVEEPLLR